MEMPNLRLPGLHRFRREIWSIGIVPQSLDSIIATGLTATPHWLEPAPNNFLADPFGLVLPDGRRCLYAERLRYTGAGAENGKGDIVGACFDPGEMPDAARLAPMASEPFHMSYPSVERDGKAWLMFTESWESGGLVTFAAARPEGPWRRHRRLLRGVPVIDPTLFEHRGRWYLFCTRHDRGALSRLQIFTARHLLGPWHPHPMNPVKRDRGSARPAGPIFRGGDGHLYRPGQDCSRTYGGAVVIHRINALSPETFHETPVRRIDPVPGTWGDGLHTICAFGADTLIDGKRYRWSISEPIDNPRRRRREAVRRLAASRHEEGDGHG